MNKLTQRLLTFFIGIPVIVGCAAISWANHLLLHLAIIATTTLTAYELTGIMSKSTDVHHPVFNIILADIIPIVTGLHSVYGFPFLYVVLTVLLVLYVVFIVEIWGYDRTTGSFEKSCKKISSSLGIIVYSGVSMSFISAMAAFEQVSALVSLFLLLIFGCDSCAWLFGMTMGKNNRGVVAASPNKSVMGFIGGYVGSFIAVVIACLIFPVLEGIPFWKLAILSVSTSTTAILGDLVESVMKRSSNTKDSGNLIPGRGGLLDSADSIIFSAPVYYFLIILLLGM